MLEPGWLVNVAARVRRPCCSWPSSCFSRLLRTLVVVRWGGVAVRGPGLAVALPSRRLCAPSALSRPHVLRRRTPRCDDSLSPSWKPRKRCRLPFLLWRASLPGETAVPGVRLGSDNSPPRSIPCLLPRKGIASECAGYAGAAPSRGVHEVSGRSSPILPVRDVKLAVYRVAPAQERLTRVPSCAPSTF